MQSFPLKGHGFSIELLNISFPIFTLWLPTDLKYRSRIFVLKVTYFLIRMDVLISLPRFLG